MTGDKPPFDQPKSRQNQGSILSATGTANAAFIDGNNTFQIGENGEIILNGPCKYHKTLKEEKEENA